MSNTTKQSKISNDIGMRIKNMRKKNHISSSDFGMIMGVAASTISNWEAGRAVFPAAQIYELAKKLGVSPAWLLTGEGEMETKKEKEA